MYTVLLYVSGALFFYYFVTPILIRTVTWMNPEPRIEPVWLEYLPPEIGNYLRGAAESLAADGFAPVAHLHVAAAVPNVESILTLFINAATRDKAMAVVFIPISQNAAQPRPSTKYIEFSTRYADGAAIDTNNSSELSAFKDVPEKRTFRLPQVREPGMLYRIHQAMMQQIAPGMEKVLPAESDITVYLRRVFQEDFERQAGIGLLYRNASDGLYRMTWEGAYRMTWGLLWPMKLWRKAARNRQAARLLRSLNLEPSFTSPASHPPASRY